MPLCPFAAQSAELVELLGPLDTLGDDGEVEGAGQSEDGADNGGVLGVAAEAGDEGA